MEYNPITSVEIYEKEKTFVFPTVSEGQFYIKVEEEENTLQLIDMKGAILLKKQLTLGTNYINAGTLPSGTYIAKIGQYSYHVIFK